MNHFLGGLIWETQSLPSSWQDYLEAPRSMRLMETLPSGLKFFMEWEDPAVAGKDLQIINRKDVALFISGSARIRVDFSDLAAPVDLLVQQLLADRTPEAALQQIDGEFGFIGIHKASDTVYLAIDPVGSRNLYYRKLHGGIIWGTNLLDVSKDRLILSKIGLNFYLNLKGIPAPYSILDGVNKVSPGSFVRLRLGGFQEEVYWHLEEKIRESVPGNYEETQMELLQLLKKSIVETLNNVDGNIGAFLSGGLDSSIIVSLAKTSGIPLTAYSVGYKDKSYTDETAVASALAGMLGIPLIVYKCSPSDVFELIQQKLNDEIEPVADSAFFPELLLARTVSDKKVILDGTGADCIFGGSNKYIAGFYLDKFRKIPAPIRDHIINPLSQLLPASRKNRVTNAIRKLQFFLEADQVPESKRDYYWYYFFTSSQLKSILLPAWQLDDQGWIDAYLLQQMSLLQGGKVAIQSFTTLKTILSSVELFKLYNLEHFGEFSIRKPFLSAPIVEMGLRIPDEYKVQDRVRKKILRDLGEKILPEEILRYPKTNFNPPITKWIVGPFRELFMDTLASENGIFDVSAVKMLELRNRIGWRDASSQLWAIFVLNYWLDGNHVTIPATILPNEN